MERVDEGGAAASSPRAETRRKRHRQGHPQGRSVDASDEDVDWLDVEEMESEPGSPSICRTLRCKEEGECGKGLGIICSTTHPPAWSSLASQSLPPTLPIPNIVPPLPLIGLPITPPYILTIPNIVPPLPRIIAHILTVALCYTPPHSGRALRRRRFSLELTRGTRFSSEAAAAAVGGSVATVHAVLAQAAAGVNGNLRLNKKCELFVWCGIWEFIGLHLGYQSHILWWFRPSSHSFLPCR